MELGKKIIKLRKDNNLTQVELAEKYFVTRQTVSNWENGRNYPDLETIVKISDDFNISLDILLKEDIRMLKNIDNSVRATKKYKNILKYTFIFVCLLIFVSYKVVMLNKYQWNMSDFDTSMIFNETLTITSNIENNSDCISIDNMSFSNYFDNFVDAKNNSNFKVKYDNDNIVVSFYSLSSQNQFINILSKESLEIGFDNTNGKVVNTSDSMRKYLNSQGIKNDIDLLKYIKDNYYFKNNIFTLTKTMKSNYLLNSFVDTRLLTYKNIVLINGSIDGYIINAKTTGINDIKEIHILKDNKQYILLLSGTEVTDNNFIIKLLSSIKFS